MKKLFIVTLALLSSFVFAAPQVEEGPGCEGLRIGTGPHGKGYSNLFVDIQKVCGNEAAICEVNTNGGLDNLNALSTNDVDIGFTQLDTAMYMQNGDENIKDLQALMSVNYNFLHILVNSNGYTVTSKSWGGLKKDEKVYVVTKASELKGLTVAAVGSAQLMGRKINSMMNLGMNVIDATTDDKAFDMVRKGEAHAMMTVSGWPSGPVKKLSTTSGLTMIPWDLASSTPYVVKSVNYANLGVYNINILGVPNLLMTRPFKGSKGLEVSKLKACLKANLQDLQEGNGQPAWKEIKDPENVFGWVKFQAVSVPVSTNSAPAKVVPVSKKKH